MQSYHKTLLTVILLICSLTAFTQDNDAKALIKQGIALNDAGKYEEAIGKYNQALKSDPVNQEANYEIAYTYFTTGKETEAIPYLEKVIKQNPSAAGAYDMLGSIYDDLNQQDKALENYMLGIKADASYQRLHFNLGILYLRQKKYPEAEQAAIDAIKLNPKHASSQRLYALATFNEGKRDCSLLAWCSFLMLEPQTNRSVEGCNYLKYIINYGIKRTGEKSVNVSVFKGEQSSYQLMMQIAVLAATTGKANLSPVDSVNLQLTEIFKIAHSLAEKYKTTFFSKYYADYFNALVASGNMPAFTRYITLSIYKDEDVAWFKEHANEIKDLNNWVSLTDRKFE